MDGYTVDEIFDDIRLKISNIYQKNGDIDLFIEMDYGLWDFIYRNTKINCLSHLLFTNKTLFGVAFFVKKKYPHEYGIFTKGIFGNKIFLGGGLTKKDSEEKD